MYSFYEIITNLILLVMGFVYKYILPLALIVIVFEVVSYMFSGKEAKERIIEKIRAIVIGFALICALPLLLMGLVSGIAKVTGVDVNFDTSILKKLTNGKTMEVKVDSNLSSQKSIDTTNGK